MKLRTGKIEKWIEIKDDEGGVASFLVKPMNPKETTSLLESSSKADWERGQRFKEPNFYKFKIEKIDKTIIDWNGVEDEDGREMECNRKNKEIAYLNNAELIDKVLEIADNIGKGAQASYGEEIKN